METQATDIQRYQYRIVQLGMFSTADRLAAALSELGRNGWELVTIYDKSSNWLNNMEKGFALFKRDAPENVADDEWCIVDERGAHTNATTAPKPLDALRGRSVQIKPQVPKPQVPGW